MPSSNPSRVIPDKDIAGIALNAGFKGAALEKAVAVALAESGGNANAMGDTTIQTSTWGPSVGLWQIRSLKAENGKGTPRDASRLKDPSFNAKAAWSISSGGTNFKPWSVYTSGRYLMYVNRAKKAVKDNGGAATVTGEAGDPNAPGTHYDTSDPFGIIPDGLQALPQAVGMLAKAGAWMADRENWVRVAKVVLGGAVIVAGVAIAARPLISGAAREAAEIVPAGQAVQAAMKVKGA